MTARQTLTYRLVRAYGPNPRDWQECQTVERAAAALVATLTDEQVTAALRSGHRLTAPRRD